MLLNPYILGGSSSPPPRNERTPMQLSFSPYSSTFLFEPQPLHPSALDFNDTFSSVSSLEVEPIKFGGVVGTVSTTGSLLTVSGSTGTVLMEKSSVSSYIVPDVFVELGVSQQGSSTGLDIVQVGVFLDGSNFIVASVDRSSGLAWIQNTTTADSSRLGQINYTVPSGSFRLGFGMVGTKAAVYLDAGSGWLYVTGADLGVASFSTPASLTGWRAGFCMASTNASTWKYYRLRSTRFGAVGFRDPTLMTNRDGTPYVSNGKAYLTASTNLVAAGGEYSRQTMHELDLSSMQIRVCGVFYVLRDGSFSPDINLHIVDAGNGTQDLFWATWGTGPFSGGALQVVHSTFTGSAQFGVLLLSSWTPLSLPTPGGSHSGAYDPMLSFREDTWTAAYSIVADTTNFGGGFWPGRAVSSDLSVWSSVASDPSGANTFEGTKLYRAAEVTWELAGGPQGAGNKARIYNESVTYQGDLTATFNGGTDTQPHPMIFNYGDYAWLITFDNARTDGVQFSWGRYIVQRAPRYL